MRNKKVLVSLFLVASLIIGSSVNVAASYGSHTGTSASVSWTAGTDRTIHKATCQGWTNDVSAYTVTHDAD